MNPKGLAKMSDEFFLINAEGLDKTQEKLLLAAVKSHSDAWWHESPNLWIVKGGGPGNAWAQRLGVITNARGSRYLLFRLPASGKRHWGGRHSAQGLDWIASNYADSNGVSPNPPSPAADDASPSHENPATNRANDAATPPTS